MVLPEQVTVAQPIKKSFALYGTRRFITVITKFRNLTISSHTGFYSTHSHLRPGLLGCHFSSKFTTKHVSQFRTIYVKWFFKHLRKTWTWQISFVFTLVRVSQFLDTANLRVTLLTLQQVSGREAKSFVSPNLWKYGKTMVQTRDGGNQGKIW